MNPCHTHEKTSILLSASRLEGWASRTVVFHMGRGGQRWSWPQGPLTTSGDTSALTWGPLLAPRGQRPEMLLSSLRAQARPRREGSATLEATGTEPRTPAPGPQHPPRGPGAWRPWLTCSLTRGATAVTGQCLACPFRQDMKGLGTKKGWTASLLSEGTGQRWGGVGANLVAGRPCFSHCQGFRCFLSWWEGITFKVIGDYLQFTPSDCRFPGC